MGGCAQAGANVEGQGLTGSERSTMRHESRPWRILLVEDNLADICLFRLALNEAGLQFDLTALHDGAEALAFVRREGKYFEAPRPDLVVLDLRLPMHS